MAEPGGVTVVDRKTLYAEVWSTPGRTLAKKYGVSDVALAKACHRHQIPRPPRGHWAKLAAGKPSVRSPLPPLHDPRLQEVRFYGGQPRSAAVARSRDVSAGQAECRQPAIVVAERLKSPHALVTTISNHLRARQTEEFRTGPDRYRVPAVSVAARSLPRALRILDALFKAWESLGGHIDMRRDWFESNKDAIYFSVDEDYTTVILYEKEKTVPGTGPNHWWRETTCTGQLALRLTHVEGKVARATWADGKRQRLEDSLGSVVSVLLELIDGKRQDRLERAIRSRQKEAVARRRAAVQQRATEEKQRREELETQLGQWEYANRIRDYIAAIDEGLAKETLRVRDEDAYATWRRWVCWYADEVDPLVKAEPLPDETPPPDNTPVANLEFTNYTAPIITRLGVADTDALHTLTREQVEAADGNGLHEAWPEICDVLEGLGYNVPAQPRRR